MPIGNWSFIENRIKGITQAELEKRVGASRPGVSRTLGKLTKDADNEKTRDLVYMEPDAIDTRSLGVYLTPKGKALKKRFTLLK